MTFRQEVLKALKDRIISGDEAKALFRRGGKEIPIFLFMDDMTETDYLINSGLNKMGKFPSILMEGSGVGFMDVVRSEDE